MNINWIFFDVGGVLSDESRYFNFRVNIDLDIIKKYKPEVTRQDILNIWPKISAIQSELDESVFRWFIPEAADEAIAEMRERKQSGPSYTEQQQIRPEAAAVAYELSKKYKLGLIANQHNAIKEKLTTAGVLKYFQHTSISDDYKLEKPNPEIFRITLNEVGADASNSVMIDDNIERSLIPAKQIGMTTVWYQLEDRDVQANIVDYKIRSLNDLLSIF
ncbi:MAG: HAD family hydrolase [Candidatus Doudnabacteria bacterium]|nr:HAD family hydrolase [Candidatus Doudnabacteria bacterium]